MFSKLYDYCRWNWHEKVKAYLDKNLGIDITDHDGICVRLAISHNSPEILEALFKYFKASLPENRMLPAHAISIKKMGDIFDEYIDFGDIPYEMKKITLKFFPSIAEKGLIESAGNGDIQTIKELYPDLQKTSKELQKELLSIAISGEEDEVIDTIANMAKTDRQKAMVLRKAADLYSDHNNFEKTSVFYEKAIKACSSYFTSHLHYANYIQKQSCTDISFDPVMAAKAESYYKTVIEHAPNYSCAHKKLGILYQIWSESKNEQDLAGSETLVKKAIDSYVQAIECKIANLQYDSLYSEIEYLIEKFRFQGLEQTLAVPITDARLKELFAPKGEVNAASNAVPEDMYTVSTEDIEYEECDMDDDLESLSSDITDTPLGDLLAVADSQSAATAHIDLDETPPISLSGNAEDDSD